MKAASSGLDGICLGRTRRAVLLAQLAPSYMLHMASRRYRRQLREASPPGAVERARTRHSAAALDAWVSQLLSAYSDVTRSRLRRESGPLAVRYIRLMAAMNREYEYRLATRQTLKLDEVCASPLIAAGIQEWERFSASHTDQPGIIGFLACADFTQDYAEYVTVTTREGFNTDVGLQMESISLDSGGYLARLVRLIGEFNDGLPAVDVLRQVHDLGIAAKLTDEFTDLATDYSEGRYNLLLAMLQQEPDESAYVMRRLKSLLPMPLVWWQREAPRTFGQFTCLYQQYYLRLRSPNLRRVCDTTMLRAMSGPKRRHGARPAQRVSEPPRDPWR